uniref:Polyadenylate-binding protein 7 n=1 Tax=Tanacetum cinerariifolium TaxID=118510 RepID=A0A699HRU6_TANCI|nr:polyadenylate-binding protein 7 [Tanacetum cinerariifolium]
MLISLMMINWCRVPAAFWIGSGIGIRHSRITERTGEIEPTLGCKHRAKAKTANSPLQLNGTTKVPPAVVLNTTNATSEGATSDTPSKIAFDACNTTTTDSGVMQHTLTTYQPVRKECGEPWRKHDIKESERQQILRHKFKEWRTEQISKCQGSNVYVKNIDKLQECFSQCGTITALELLLKEKGTSNMFGFVCFSTPEAVTRGMTRAKSGRRWQWQSGQKWLACGQKRDHCKKDVAGGRGSIGFC